jgi:hypothetical protein
MLGMRQARRVKWMPLGLVALATAVPDGGSAQSTARDGLEAGDGRVEAIRVGLGSRVRLTLHRAPGDQIEGWLEAVERCHLTLAGVKGAGYEGLVSLGASLVRVPLADIALFEVRTKRGGRGKASRTGIGLGAVFGLVGGLAVASTVVESCSGEWLCFDDLERFTYGMAGAATGALVGGVVGHAVGPDGWSVVPLERLQASTAHPDSLLVQASLR